MTRKILRTITRAVAFIAVLLMSIGFLDSLHQVLPTSLHNRIQAPHWHHSGYVITDITYQACNWFFSSCSPPGDWHRIEKDVFLDQSMLFKGYTFVKRKKEKHFNSAEGDSMIVDVAVGKAAPTTGDGWEYRPGGMWIRKSNILVDSGITAVDVLFGQDAVEVRPQWNIVGDLDAGDHVKLTVRRGQPRQEVERPELRINDDMKFKIIQISDMHLSTGVGRCRDILPDMSTMTCEADPLTLQYLEKILEIEKPDLAVLAGDMINGETAPDAQSAIFKFANLFIKRKTPYTCLFGNHDDRGNLPREQLMAIISSLPYSLSEAGPELGRQITGGGGQVHWEGGVGNYLLEVLSHRSHSHQSAITLYFFDSHSYAMEKLKKNGQKFRVYDWVKESQIQWFTEQHKHLKNAHEKYAYMHIDMAFTHIPLPEIHTVTNYVLGRINEYHTAPVTNSGLAEALIEHGVSIVSHGHDHTNEFCMLEREDSPRKQGGLWMCHSGVAGFGGYGTAGELTTQRKVRLFEIDPQARRITSWKREFGREEERLDEQVLVIDGRAHRPRI